MNLDYINQELNTAEKCVEYLENKRWNGTPTCPHCQSQKTSQKNLRRTCLGCNRSFSVRVGTVFQHSNLPLQKWLMAITLMLSAKKGISSLQLSRDIKVNKNTAWLMQMKIRSAMSAGELDAFIDDEAKTRLELKVQPWEKFLHRRKHKSTVNFITARHLKNFGTYGFKGLLKRAIVGQYHKIDEFYLEHYVDEVQYKFDRKSEVDGGYAELLGRILVVTVAK
jgi:transposase-like protein